MQRQPRQVSSIRQAAIVQRELPSTVGNLDGEAEGLDAEFFAE
eukprot:CAMPEP_0113677198 /NCGR_PEP_ID=MMETSP0038_2-20120614/9111_1 /TAXON_ID=2898 /ORGANISM="Cryptomonas paramecium" /LENGTH=42 /DNA_ID=CAMNT_0000594403 /DNA_START=398 /DNA_END=526 /DNA_ORIENTATION=- /assembly_acc=CAM_ASM_000170